MPRGSQNFAPLRSHPFSRGLQPRHRAFRRPITLLASRARRRAHLTLVSNWRAEELIDTDSRAPLRLNTPDVAHWTLVCNVVRLNHTRVSSFILVRGFSTYYTTRRVDNAPEITFARAVNRLISMKYEIPRVDEDIHRFVVSEWKKRTSL